LIDQIKDKISQFAQTAARVIHEVISWIVRFWGRLKERGIIENFKEAFEKVGTAVKTVFETLKEVANTFIAGFEVCGRLGHCR